jgi:transposase
MPRRQVSNDLKARIPVLFYELGMKPAKICKVLGIKKSLVYDTLAYHRAYGVPYNPYARRLGRPRLLTISNTKYIHSLLSKTRTMYLYEIQEELKNSCNINISIPTIFRTIRRIYFSRKGVSAVALERNNMKRSHFWNEIADIVTDPDQLMFTDEASRNRKTQQRRFGYALKGRRCIVRLHFVRGQRISILPVLTMDGIITYDLIPGPVTSARFLEFLKEHVVSFPAQNLMPDY